MRSEKWPEFGQDFIANEFVERGEFRDDFAGYPWFLKRYLKGDLRIQCFCAFSGVGVRDTNNYVATIEASGVNFDPIDLSPQIGHVEGDRTLDWNALSPRHRGIVDAIRGDEQSTVFVDGVQQLDIPQRFIPTLIRLQSFDDYLGLYGKGPNLADSRFMKTVATWAGVFVDRELGERALGTLNLRRKSPDDMVQYRAQIVDEIARHYREMRRASGFGTKAPDPQSAIRIMVHDHCVAIKFLEQSAGLRLDVFQMLLSPFEFGGDPFREGFQRG
jgi:hypothetical protein